MNRLIQRLSTIKTDLTFKTRYGQFVFHNNEHGICGQIPACHARPGILASICNPCDQLVSQPSSLGYFSRESVHYYFRSPAEILSRFDDEYLAARQFQKDTYPVQSNGVEISSASNNQAINRTASS